jgi:hypothetical protein
MIRKNIGIFVLTLLLGLPIIAVSQNKYKKGYYITLQNDTVQGSVFYKRTNDWHLAFVTDNNEKKLLEADEINGYFCDGKTYKSTSIVSNKYFIRGTYFLEVKIEGAISLYLYSGQEYIQKHDDDFQRLNSIIKWGIVKEYIKDNASLYSYVNSNEKETLKVDSIIIAYNNWYNYNGVEQSNYDTLGKDSLPDSSVISQPPSTTQEFKAQQTQKRFNVKINLLSTGIGLETKITDNISLYIESGIDIDLWKDIFIYPFFSVQPRFYTNLNKRALLGKTTEKFSGNYLSPYFVYMYPIGNLSSNETDWFLYGFTYGFQRKKAKYFYWGVDVGVGLQSYQDHTNYDYNTMSYTSRNLEPRIIWKINLGLLY